jgi:cytochrome b561
MAVANTDLRYGSVAMTFHWIIATLLIANLALGLWFAEFMTHKDPNLFAVVQIHKSIGLTVLVLSLLRLGWRLINPVPPLPRTMGPGLRALAHTSHFLLYAFMIVIPLSGWLMVSASSIGLGTPFFGLFHVPDAPFLSSLPRAERHPYHEMFGMVHVYLAWAMIVLVPVHVAAALYHQFLSRDDVLKRMLPGTRVSDPA